jgi:putative ABC transport system permease protein
VRFACRSFARQRATTAIIIAVIGLGTGANTVIFSTFQGTFVRPAPAVPDDDAHVRIRARERPTRAAAWEARGFSQAELTALTDRREIFRDVAAWTSDRVILNESDSAAPRNVAAQFVTPNYFGTLGSRLAAGHGFQQSAAGGLDVVAIASFALAEQLSGSAAGALGRRILVNQVPVRIVGVAPPRFQGVLRNMGEPALWMPLTARVDIARVSRRWLTDEARLLLFARLASTASLDQAAAFTQQVVTTALPDSATRVGMARTAEVFALSALPPGSDANAMRIAMTLIMAIGALILLVGWMNVSALMVAAAVRRRHEIAVRLSLGATRGRLLRQLVTESTLLAFAGSAVGLMIGSWLLLYQEKTEIDGSAVAPDAGTFAFVFGMAMATGILFGLSPALHATRGAVSSALRDSGSGSSSRSRLQRWFVVAQIALSQPLLVLIGMTLSVATSGFEPLSPEMSRQVITVAFRPLTNGAPGQTREAVDALIPRITERAEVVGVAPEPAPIALRAVVAPNRAPKSSGDIVPATVQLVATAPGWFSLTNVPVVLGRDVSFADTAAVDYPVVIGTDLARALWGNASPIGRTLTSPALPGGGAEQDSIAMTVIGVYDATRRLPGMEWSEPTANGTMMGVFTARGAQWRRDAIVVRTRGPAEPFLPELRRFVRALAPSLPVNSMVTLAQEDEQQYRESLKMSVWAGIGGGIALLLTSLGLYGVVALAVRQRTREIGVRIALGAHPMRVARMFLASGVRASLVGLALGLPLSIAAVKIASSQGLGPPSQTSPYLVGAVIAFVVLAVASAATWIPARRAARVDPASTLRVD